MPRTRRGRGRGKAQSQASEEMPEAEGVGGTEESEGEAEMMNTSTEEQMADPPEVKEAVSSKLDEALMKIDTAGGEEKKEGVEADLPEADQAEVEVKVNGNVEATPVKKMIDHWEKKADEETSEIDPTRSVFVRGLSLSIISETDEEKFKEAVIAALAETFGLSVEAFEAVDRISMCQDGKEVDVQAGVSFGSRVHRNRVVTQKNKLKAPMEISITKFPTEVIVTTPVAGTKEDEEKMEEEILTPSKKEEEEERKEGEEEAKESVDEKMEMKGEREETQEHDDHNPEQDEETTEEPTKDEGGTPTTKPKRDRPMNPRLEQVLPLDKIIRSEVPNVNLTKLNDRIWTGNGLEFYWIPITEENKEDQFRVVVDSIGIADLCNPFIYMCVQRARIVNFNFINPELTFVNIMARGRLTMTFDRDTEAMGNAKACLTYFRPRSPRDQVKIYVPKTPATERMLNALKSKLQGHQNTPNLQSRQLLIRSVGVDITEAEIRQKIELSNLIENVRMVRDKLTRPCMVITFLNCKAAILTQLLQPFLDIGAWFNRNRTIRKKCHVIYMKDVTPEYMKRHEIRQNPGLWKKPPVTDAKGSNQKATPKKDAEKKNDEKTVVGGKTKAPADSDTDGPDSKRAKIDGDKEAKNPEGSDTASKETAEKKDEAAAADSADTKSGKEKEEKKTFPSKGSGAKSSDKKIQPAKTPRSRGRTQPLTTRDRRSSGAGGFTNFKSNRGSRGISGPSPRGGVWRGLSSSSRGGRGGRESRGGFTPRGPEGMGPRGGGPRGRQNPGQVWSSPPNANFGGGGGNFGPPQQQQGYGPSGPVGPGIQPGGFGGGPPSQGGPDPSGLSNIILQQQRELKELQTMLAQREMAAARQQVQQQQPTGYVSPAPARGYSQPVQPSPTGYGNQMQRNELMDAYRSPRQQQQMSGYAQQQQQQQPQTASNFNNRSTGAGVFDNRSAGRYNEQQTAWAGQQQRRQQNQSFDYYDRR